MVGKGVIEKCKSIEGQILSKIFIVAKPDNMHRLILNLKHLNEFIVTTYFKMGDYRISNKLIDKSSYMTTLDLKDAYYLVAIDPLYRKFLRFQFLDEIYEFTYYYWGIYYWGYLLPYKFLQN